MSGLKDSYLSTSEAAKILGYRPYCIQQALRSGRIPAEKIANRWLIPRDFIEDFAKTYVPKVGRPRAKRKYTRRQQQ